MTGPWIVAFLALTALTVLNGALLLAIGRYVGSLATRLPQPLALELTEGPPKGSRLDAESLPPSVIERLGLDGGPEDGSALVVFLSTGCASCLALLDDLNLFSKDRPETRILPVISGERATAERMRAALPRLAAVVDVDGPVARAFAVQTVPFALLYRNRELVAKGVVNSRDMLESLLAGRVREHGDELLEAFTRSGRSAPDAPSGPDATAGPGKP